MGYVDGTSAIEMLDSVFEVLEGGKSVEAAKVSELIADNGAKICDITSYTTNAANGAAAEVAEVVNIEAGAAAGTTTGAGILAMDVGAAGAAIAPALGIAAGYGLYNLTPDFWNAIADELIEAGATVKGKVIGFIDKSGITSFTRNVIEKFKDAFINAGVYNDTLDFPALSQNYTFTVNGGSNVISSTLYNALSLQYGTTYAYYRTAGLIYPISKIQWRTLVDGEWVILNEINNPIWYYASKFNNDSQTNIGINMVSEISQTVYNNLKNLTSNIAYFNQYGEEMFGGSWSGRNEAIEAVYNGVTKYFIRLYIDANEGEPLFDFYKNITTVVNLGVFFYQYLYFSAFNSIISSTNKQPDATYPEPGIEFPQTYPEWEPAQFPEPLPQEIPEPYPVALPEPDTVQDPAQSGENQNEAQQDQLLNIFYNTLPDPRPHILPDIDPSIEPEPEPAPQPEPQPNPTDPNPEPPPSDPTIALPVLDTTSANRMFTVYNPTDAQVNSLGAFLWNSNIIEQIKKLWENPMDGIISFHKIYGAPVTGSTKNIILGYIDSGVSALEVTSQFTQIDCGTVRVPERLHNATDYSPFTALHVYLPFIGIVELDTDECMNADLHIVYRIDVYTGTCVALIYAKRDADMPQEQIIYTFSGNASQKLPLTAADFSGAIGALLGLAGAGVAVASGGSLGVAAGALGAAHSLTSEMVHIQHSGGLSANAGILSPRVPYLILSRQYGYDANGYSGFYGYPANKTVYIGNCNGYIKCKDVIFRGSCTEEEAEEIVTLLKDGVYV